MLKNEILKDLFFIERGYLNANHFVYRSQFPILIDTGYISDFNETERLIKELGVELPDVSLIINTHSHCDHIGGNCIIQQKSGCGIALHETGKYFIDSKDDWSTWWRYYNQEAAFFNCTKALADGEEILIGPHHMQVIHTPGHASDGIVLYNEKQKVMISSDTLWENDMAVMTLRIEGNTALFRMLESLHKIESLDVKRVYPGHGRPFTDFKKALLKGKARIEKYLLHQDLIGEDLIKKIIIFTLMMKKTMGEDEFFSYLMGTCWYKETVDLYFNGDYEIKYNEIMEAFFNRGIIKKENGKLVTIIKP